MSLIILRTSMKKEDQLRIGHDVDVRGTGDLDINDHVFIGRDPHVSS